MEGPKPTTTDRFFLLSVSGIARKSAVILLKHLCFFSSIAIVLLSPVSAALLLSRALLPHTLIVTDFALRIRAFGRAAGHPNSLYIHLIYNKLSEIIVCNMLCFPFVITLSLFARAAVAYTMAHIYRGHKPSFHTLVEVLPKLWKRAVITYLVAAVLVLGVSVAVLVLVSAAAKVLHVLGFSWSWAVGAAFAGLIVYSIVFGHAMIVLNLAIIVSIMEKYSYGPEAVLRAVYLIRGRTRIALVMTVIVNLGWAFVESLFEYRVVGRNGSSSGMNMAWEGPLLMLMYSAVSLMGDLMSSVFYYTCKSSRLEGVSAGECRSMKNLGSESNI